MKELGEQATKALEKTNSQMKKQFNKYCQSPCQYSIGDKVWLEATNLKTKQPTKKMDDKQVGPFKILKKVSIAAYKLKLPSTWRHHSVFNESLLTPYIAPKFPSQTIPRPPPELDEEGVPLYEVEKILSSRKVRRGTQYLVKWKGYPELENTWEPEQNLTQALDVLTDFKRSF
jgi:Chromo (CHRromatin Organisation MOdifier) domain